MAECQHMRTVPVPEPEARTQGCEECLAIGQEWVQLRKCLECGHVGCCDSSIGQHATKHFSQTGHPVMRSFEPGAQWRYCYEDKEMA
ncbi:MAG: UBP-type zinc finger domain-containing protein [Coriobacteriia bacterium]|nr:UBP-type zinc finger domain-containing protein [Coriobacteriia bacterium]